MGKRSPNVGAGIHPGIDRAKAAHRRTLAIAHFGQDHAALLVDFLGQQLQATGIIGHHPQAEVDGCRFGVGQIQLVDGFLEAGVGIGMVAKADALCLQGLDQGAGREVFRAIEGEVLEVMGHALFGARSRPASRRRQRGEW